jgi:hypothetical protein
MENDKTPNLNSTIVRKLFLDTKQGRVNWFRPFELQKEFYTAYIYLKEPRGSHLKFVLKKPDETFELVIFFVRVKGVEEYKAEEVRKIYNKTLPLLIKAIEEQLEKNKTKQNLPNPKPPTNTRVWPPNQRLTFDEEIPY